MCGAASASPVDKGAQEEGRVGRSMIGTRRPGRKSLRRILLHCIPSLYRRAFVKKVSRLAVFPAP
jgi:hypothetical protein